LGAKQINKTTLPSMPNPTPASNSTTGSVPQAQAAILSFGGIHLSKLRVPDPNDTKYWRESFDVKSYRDDFAAWRQEIIRHYNNLKTFARSPTIIASDKSYNEIADEIANLLGRIVGLNENTEG